MKYYLCILVLVPMLLVGCVTTKEKVQETPQISEEKPTEPAETVPEIEEPTPDEETEQETIEEEPQPEEIKEEKPEQQPIEEELQIGQEQPEPNEKEQIQQILNYPPTKIKSYSYQYKDSLGFMYEIHVKGNKIRISSLSSDNKIYLDTEKKTAEEYCISHTKCGKETGKIADLDYYDSYVETPIDWLAKITIAKKIDEGFYYGKKSWKLDTNIGEVTIDSNFGFIYKIKQKDKEYLFTDAKFNIVEDSDVNIPKHLLPGYSG